MTFVALDSVINGAAVCSTIAIKFMKNKVIVQKLQHSIRLNTESIPKLPQDAYFRAITALAEQGTLAKECNYLSNKCNAVLEAL